MPGKYKNDPQGIGPYDWPAKQVPGPGAYDDPRKVQNGPQYSMRMKGLNKVGNNNPAPTDYNPDVNFYSVKEAPKGVKFGKDERDGLYSKNANPAPGAYEYDANPIKQRHKEVRFGTEARMGPAQKNLDHPAPGTYNLETEFDAGKRTNAGKTLGAKFSRSPSRNNPGPGEYDAAYNGYKVNAPQYSIPKDARGEKLSMENPGPGTYQPGYNQKLRNDPAYGFGTGVRQPINDPNANPGPDTYAIDRKVGEGPQYSMRTKADGIRPDNNPAGTDYNPNIDFYSVKQNAPHIGIGTSERQPLNPYNDNPGPSSYNQNQDPIKKSAPNRQFGSENRMGPRFSQDNVPGAGTYKLEPEIEEGLRKNKGKTMEGKHYNDHVDKTPGVGTYSQDVNPLRKSAPKFSMPRDSKLKDEKYLVENPGPGQYDPSIEQKVRRDPAYGFGTGQRKPLNDPNANPGAGTYEIDRVVGDGPEFTMRMKSSGIKQDQTPAGGDYDPKIDFYSVKQNAPHIKIGTGQRPPINPQNDNPAPGDYDQNQNPIKKKAREWKFGTEDRMGPQDKMGIDIGPGNYEHETEFDEGLRKNKGKTMEGKNVTEYKEIVPGVGTYNQDVNPLRKSAPHYSMPRDAKLKDEKYLVENPGPGQYDPSIEQKVRRDPAYGFGTGQRKPLNDPNVNPGAGTYEIDRIVGDGPEFTMRMKTDGLKKDQTPAGTDYNPNINTYSVKQNAPHIGIGTSVRPPLNAPNANPAPGDYEYDQDAIRNSASSWKFGTQNRMGPVDKMGIDIGPGNYDHETEIDQGLRKNKGKTMEGKNIKDHKEAVPGVGTYEPEVNPIKNKAPLYSMPRDAKLKDEKYLIQNPGPGQYDPSIEQKVRRDPAYGFGTGQRKPLNDPNANPGAGTYEIDRVVGDGPEFTMRMKTLGLKVDQTPAGTDYNPKINTYSVKQNAPHIGIGTSVRPPLNAPNANPAPGDYNYDQDAIRNSASSWKFGTQNRMGIKDKMGIEIGPGNYDHETEIDEGLRKNKGKTMEGKNIKEHKESVPGVGTYQPEVNPIKNKAPLYSMPRDSKLKDEKYLIQNPGPGQYDPSIEQKVRRDPAYGFGTGQRKPLNDPNANPGAGTYEIDRVVGDGPLFTMRMKTDGLKKDQTPAGTDYNPNINTYSVKQNAPHIGIGTSTRPPLNAPNANPAPGDYEYDQDAIRNSASSWKFGTQNRMGPVDKMGIEIGPGNYDHETEIDEGLRKNKGKTMEGKNIKDHKEAVPLVLELTSLRLILLNILLQSFPCQETQNLKMRNTLWRIQAQDSTIQASNKRLEGTQLMGSELAKESLSMILTLIQELAHTRLTELLAKGHNLP